MVCSSPVPLPDSLAVDCKVGFPQAFRVRNLSRGPGPVLNKQGEVNCLAKEGFPSILCFLKLPVLGARIQDTVKGRD